MVSGCAHLSATVLDLCFLLCENGRMSKCVNVRFARQRVQGEEFNTFVVAQRDVKD